MLTLNVSFEFEDRQTARNITGWVRTLAEQRPPEVDSLQEVTTAGGLEAGDWHFLELLICFGAGVSAGAAKKVGERVVDGIQWLARALWERLRADPETAPPAPGVAAPDDGGRLRPTVRLEVHRGVNSLTLTITPLTTEDALRQFAEAAGQLEG